MSTRFFWFALALPLLGLIPLRSARAEDMQLALSRLSRGACQNTLSNSNPFVLRTGDVQTLTEDNAAWAQIMTQLTPVITPAVLAPVTTSGPKGFDVSFETNVTKISDNASYWARGSQGHGPESYETCDGRNTDVSPRLTSNRLHFTKALPLGFTLGATVGRVYNTGLWLVGGDIKLALIEGLRRWPMPDVAVRAAVNTTVGSAQYTLTSVAADVILSKNIVTARVMQISPYAGAGMVFSFASSELVDLTPNVDAVKCAAGTDPVCNSQGLGASADDIGHDRPFKDLKLKRYRGFAGLAMRYELFTLAAEFIFDLVPPPDADKTNGKGTPRQWTFNVAPGLTF
ncbi:MAG: hypothetical protein QM778_04105 [Myxococcales bacterium]